MMFFNKLIKIGSNSVKQKLDRLTIHLKPVVNLYYTHNYSYQT